MENCRKIPTTYASLLCTMDTVHLSTFADRLEMKETRERERERERERDESLAVSSLDDQNVHVHKWKLA